MDIDRNIEQAQADVARAVRTNKENVYVNPDIIVRAEAPKASWADFCHHFSQWKNLKILIGTSYSWFALDVSRIFLYIFVELLNKSPIDCVLRSRIEFVYRVGSDRFWRWHHGIR